MPHKFAEFFRTWPIGKLATLLWRRLLYIYSISDRRARILYLSGEPDTQGDRYRVVHYMRLAKMNNWQASRLNTNLREHLSLPHARYDAVVLWRVGYSAEIAGALNALRAEGTKIIFDIDDLLINPQLARAEIIDGIRSLNMREAFMRGHCEALRATMLEADYCFAATEYLASHMREAGKRTFVLPNGFDRETHDFARMMRSKRLAERDEQLIRIGYAGGSITHQKDFALAAPAVARMLKDRQNCRLVLFRLADGRTLVDVGEYPELNELRDKIEWRDFRPISELPAELARFDINLAPLECGNPFCEAKSELKFFEAALVETPTIASPTAPFRAAIEHGKTGFLAGDGPAWLEALKRLADDAALRQKIGKAAYISARDAFGEQKRAAAFKAAMEQILAG